MIIPKIAMVVRIVAGYLMIAGSQIGWASTCALQAPLPASTVQTIDADIRRRMAELHVPGVSLSIVRDGKIVLLRGYGHARLSPDMPVNPTSTLFRIGSVTKLFTYTAAFQLAERGQLDFRRDVADYLPWPVRERSALHGLTIDHILAQRPGFENADLGYDFFWDPSREPTLARFVRRYRPARIRPPGEATDYSNYAPTLLGYVVQQVSHQLYRDYVSRHILLPLGMRDTALEEPVDPMVKAPLGRMAPSLAANAALGYRWTPEGYRTLPYEHIYPAASPAGSAFSTASDMACFMLAYLQEGQWGSARLLAPSTVHALRSRKFNDRPDGPDIAQGWFNARWDGHETYGHYGSMLGFMTQLLTVPDLNLGIFITTNGANGWSVIADAPTTILKLLAPVRPGSDPPAPLPANAPAVAVYAGDYLTGVRSYTRLAKFSQIVVGEARVTAADADHLWIDLEGSRQLWKRVGVDLFAAPDIVNPIRFVRDPSGRSVRFFHPMGHRSYDRIPSWQSSKVLEAALLIGLAAGIATLLLTWLARRSLAPWQRTILLAACLSTILLPLLTWRAVRAMSDDLLEVDWPALALRQLVWAGWWEICIMIAQIACLYALWRTPAHRALKILATALALAQAVTLFAFATWNLFSPAML